MITINFKEVNLAGLPCYVRNNAINQSHLHNPESGQNKELQTIQKAA
jgi:hypothetical protein